MKGGHQKLLDWERVEKHRKSKFFQRYWGGGMPSARKKEEKSGKRRREKNKKLFKLRKSARKPGRGRGRSASSDQGEST